MAIHLAEQTENYVLFAPLLADSDSKHEEIEIRVLNATDPTAAAAAVRAFLDDLIAEGYTLPAQPLPSNRELAERIASRLFTAGDGRVADRLVHERNEPLNPGWSWSQKAMADQIENALDEEESR